jgi:transposase
MTLALAAGIDAGKSHLDVSIAPSGRAWRVPNVAKGIATLVAALSRAQVHRVVLEAIGPYAIGVVRALAEAGFDVSVVNPKRIKAFRQAEGRRAKTDRLDAALIARFALLMSDTLRPLPTEDQLAAKALATRRRQLVEFIAMEKTRLKQASDAGIADSHRATIAMLSQERKRIEADLEARLSRDPDLAAKRDLLISIPGIGPQVATVLLTDLPELGTIDRRAIASLAGLAPHISQSGNAPPRAAISGGRNCVRAALYLAALAATRAKGAGPFNAEYKAMRAAGKPAKVALIAIARKLLTIANSLAKQRRPYDPNISRP